MDLVGEIRWVCAMMTERRPLSILKTRYSRSMNWVIGGFYRIQFVYNPPLLRKIGETQFSDAHLDSSGIARGQIREKYDFTKDFYALAAEAKLYSDRAGRCRAQGAASARPRRPAPSLRGASRRHRAACGDARRHCRFHGPHRHAQGCREARWRRSARCFY